MNEEQENTPAQDNREEKASPSSPLFRIFPFEGHAKPVFLLCLLGFLFYVKTLENEYALDDGLVIMQNQYVLRGFDGIPSLVKEDYFHSFYRRMHAGDQLKGGRYRPVPVISFAVEQEMLGTYRTGYYNFCEDLNRNGRLDHDPVNFINGKGETEWNFEHNNQIDRNRDGIIQPDECCSCWDNNGNFKPDSGEDLNKDGVVNEIDCQNYGAWLRHSTNIFLYLLCCVALYLFLAKELIPGWPDLAFMSALIFLIHPVHSEVVANVKGREDLFCFLFMVLSLHQALVFVREKKAIALILGAACVFLAFLSKETAVALLVLLPLTLYFKNTALPDWKSASVFTALYLVTVAIMFLVDIRQMESQQYPIAQYYLITLVFTGVVFALHKLINTPSMKFISVTLVVSLLYLSFRLSAVTSAPDVPETEILNNPFLLASGGEKIATKVFILLKYLGLVVFPHPLVSDYSYNSIPLVGPGSISFIASLLVHLVLLAGGIWLTKKKHIAGYGLLVYMLFILIVSNLFFDTQIVMLEAYLFHATMGAGIVLGWVILSAVEPLQKRKPALARQTLYLVITVLIIVGGIKTWERCADWKNDVTLFLKDVKQAPNSVIVLGNAAARWIDLSDTKEITGNVMPGEEELPMNDYNGQLKLEEDEWKSAGYANKRDAAIGKGIGYLKTAIRLHPRYVNGYLNLGLAYFKLRDDDSTMLSWKMAEFLYPDNPYLFNYYQVYREDLLKRGNQAFEKGDYASATLAFKRVLVLRHHDAEALKGLAAVAFNEGKPTKSKNLLRLLLKEDPHNEEAKKLMEFFNMHPYPENVKR